MNSQTAILCSCYVRFIFEEFYSIFFFIFDIVVVFHVTVSIKAKINRFHKHKTDWNEFNRFNRTVISV